jgi:hypothetical protein
LHRCEQIAPPLPVLLFTTLVGVSHGGAVAHDVHHILPESQGGLSEIDNAAPLCQNCHDQFGANPEKRKFVTEMRDWWYEVCDKKYGAQGFEETIARLDKLVQMVADIQKGQEELLPSFMNLLQGLSIAPAAAASLGSAVAWQKEHPGKVISVEVHEQIVATATAAIEQVTGVPGVPAPMMPNGLWRIRPPFTPGGPWPRPGDGPLGGPGYGPTGR